MYADYQYYTQNFHGTKIPDAAAFLSVAPAAEAYLDRVTFGRADTSTVGIGDAMCAVCEVFYSDADREGISSESLDGYSVSYTDGYSLRRTLRATVRMYLEPALLYRGC